MQKLFQYKNFILEFNVLDMNTLTEKLTKFYQGALDAITAKPNLEVHKVYGGNDFTIEWIKPKTEINLLLKLCTVNGSRIIFPVNTVRLLSKNLQEVINNFILNKIAAVSFFEIQIRS